MLDTNIVSDAIRNPYGRAAERMAAMDDEMIAISAIVASELRFGAMKRGSVRLTSLIETVIGRISVLPYENVASHHFAEIRLNVERQGKPVGTTDLFIAAHARSLDLTLVTANTREFSRIPGLKVENWLEDMHDD
ncbi:type II toxin-antitoxin system VapC family toxin [Rhizobium sp. SL42]|uniref:type II toxin-antitoxin system VapC family toxin n=1 Tax=Rhizobium sp. SL42 TaxID=2806346 RepID=UPI003FA7234A